MSSSVLVNLDMSPSRVKPDDYCDLECVPVVSPVAVSRLVLVKGRSRGGGGGSRDLIPAGQPNRKDVDHREGPTATGAGRGKKSAFEQVNFVVSRRPTYSWSWSPTFSITRDAFTNSRIPTSEQQAASAPLRGKMRASLEISEGD